MKFPTHVKVAVQPLTPLKSRETKFQRGAIPDTNIKCAVALTPRGLGVGVFFVPPETYKEYKETWVSKSYSYEFSFSDHPKYS